MKNTTVEKPIEETKLAENQPKTKIVSIIVEGPNKLRLAHQGMGSTFEIESCLRWALEAVQTDIRGN